MTDGFVKSFVCKACKPGKGEAYFSYVEPFTGEAQRSRRTFYEAVDFLRYRISPSWAVEAINRPSRVKMPPWFKPRALEALGLLMA